MERMFELGINGDGKFLFYCLSKDHSIEIKEKDARDRGYDMFRWKKGNYQEPVKGEITPYESKKRVPRPKVRPKIVKEQGIVITCPVCQKAEKRAFDGWVI